MTNPDVMRTEDGALATGYNAVNETWGAIDGHLNLIRSELQEAGSGWQGEAARAFQSLMAEFDTAANNLQGVLSTLEQNLRTVETYHTSQEEEATTAVKGAAGGEFPGF